MSVAKEHLNELIQQVPDEAIPMIINLVKVILEGTHDMERKKMQQYLDSIPYDDEPLTEEDIKAIKEAKEEIARGETISMEELKRQLGL